jgi:pimeloyl-ACP methyl ester carboxylesterase
MYHVTRGEGRPIIVLHGLPIDHHYVEAALEPVFQDGSGWQRIYVDLPGFGETPREERIASNDDMVEAVVRFIDSKIPGRRFALVGESYGGYLARGVTKFLRARMDGLFLWAPALYPRESRHLPPRTVLAAGERVMEALRTDDEKFFGRLLVTQDGRGVEVVRRLAAPAASKADEPFVSRVTSGRLSFDLESETFEHPTLIICGRQDHLVGYRDPWDLLERYPRATFAVLDYAGHLVGLPDRVELFQALVRDWLARMNSRT